MGLTNEVYETISLGWCEIPLVTSRLDQIVTLNLRKGSPRELQQRVLGQPQLTSLNISFSQRKSFQFNHVKFLVPENVLVSTSDTLPGVLNQALGTE